MVGTIETHPTVRFYSKALVSFYAIYLGFIYIMVSRLFHYTAPKDVTSLGQKSFCPMGSPQSIAS